MDRAPKRQSQIGADRPEVTGAIHFGGESGVEENDSNEAGRRVGEYDSKLITRQSTGPSI
jgi:hypothetical protein